LVEDIPSDDIASFVPSDVPPPQLMFNVTAATMAAAEKIRLQ
jgi:hypothetical protein